MKTNNPKISFNTSTSLHSAARPEVHSDHAPEQELADQFAPQGVVEDITLQFEENAPQMVDDTADGYYEDAASEPFEPMPAPQPDVETVRDHEFDRAEWEERLTAPPAEPIPVLTPTPLPKPKAQNARLAAIGQMAQPEPNFFGRNGGILAAAAVVGVMFVFGLGAAMWFFADDDAREQATFSDPLREPAVVSIAQPESVTETATRALTPDLTDVSAVVPEKSTSASPSDLTSAVLAGLQQQTVAPQQPKPSDTRLNREALEILSGNKVRMLREGVLADVYDIETYEQNGVDRVRLKTINARLVGDYSSEVLLKALATGQIELSRSLITPEGAVDVETMMFNLVQTSLRNDHSTTSVEAALGMSRKIFAASVARTQNVNGARVYRVQAGDSLAYIALQFFGDPTAYKRILEVNRSTLQSPEQIQIGQRLIIPS